MLHRPVNLKTRAAGFFMPASFWCKYSNNHKLVIRVYNHPMSSLTSHFIDPDSSQPEAEDASGWLARLDLAFAQRADKSVIARRQHLGPLTLQRPFYPEGEVCHAYILHPPGGVVGGDRLWLNLEVGSAAHALVTTPASAKFYRSQAADAQQRQAIKVASGGILEYLPQDTILFDACKVDMRTRVDLEDGAKFAGWEIICLGRPASGEAFQQGRCRQAYEIYRAGKPLVLERTRLQAGAPLQSAAWGLAKYPVSGTLLISDADAGMLNLARDAGADARGLFSASIVQGVLVCRLLGQQGLEVREALAKVWSALRPAWIGRAACRPRIWDT